MLNNIDDLPDDYLVAYQILLERQVEDLPFYFLSLSDIEREYSYTVIEISGHFPTPRILKLPGTLYEYIPDQRPITMQQIGKPSSGPSNPQAICIRGLT